MKREEIVISQPFPPFYEDLVFYAPLNENDLSDHISNVQAVSLGNGSYQWYGSEFAHKLTTNTGASLGFSIANFANLIPNSFTIFAKVKVAVASTTFYIFSAGTYASNNCWPFVGTHNVGVASDTSNWHDIATVCDKSAYTQHYYKDGVLYTSLSRPANHNTWPSNWSNLLKNNVSIGTYYGYSGTAFVKDVRVYNRALTPAEVAQL